ncbi:MAG: deoxyribonuclease V [Candidatus Palauibacterales bacterium]|nr:deoxyribonuclease V [Candidatus Palauibacterales bacterium]
MDYEPLHEWDVDTDRAREIQSRLRDRLDLTAPSDFSPHRVAGADMSIGRGETRGHAAFSVLSLPGLDVVEEATASVRVDFPYVPGYLSFRELPALAAAWRELEVRPDVVLFDGQGLAHPRRMGLACHGGLLFDVPSVGCAKNLLVGDHPPLDGEKGATAPIVVEEEGRREQVGAAVRTRTDVSPIYVSPGHRMDLETAVDVVLEVSPTYRVPEPIRHADRRVGELRRSRREGAER